MPQAALSAASVRRHRGRRRRARRSAGGRVRRRGRSPTARRRRPADSGGRRGSRPLRHRQGPEQAHAIAARPARRARRAAEDARAGHAVDEASVDAPVACLDGAPGGVRDGGGSARHDVSVADGPGPAFRFLRANSCASRRPPTPRALWHDAAMRPGVPVLAAALCLAAAAPLHADEWTLIDVKSRLASDARVTVVETHDIVLLTSGRNTFRTFGLGADQAIRLMAMTRIGPDGEPHPLKSVGTVARAGRAIATTIAATSTSLSPFDRRSASGSADPQPASSYELVGAVTPACDRRCPGSRASDHQTFFWPSERVGHVVADWRRPSPALSDALLYGDLGVPCPAATAPPFDSSARLRLEHDNAYGATSRRSRTSARRCPTPTALHRDSVAPWSTPLHDRAGGCDRETLVSRRGRSRARLNCRHVVARASSSVGADRSAPSGSDSRRTRAPRRSPSGSAPERPVIPDVLARLPAKPGSGIHADRPADAACRGRVQADAPAHAPRRGRSARPAAFERRRSSVDLFRDAHEGRVAAADATPASQDYEPSA